MSREVEEADIEIESSSDTPEQVQEALGSAVEINEAPAGEETEEQSSAAATETSEEAESEAAVAEGEETEETEEEAEHEPKEKAEAKPKAKIDMVSRSRLNQEIGRRKELQRQLSEKAASRTTEKAEAVSESTEPQSFSGKAEPRIEDYVNNDKYPDPYAAFTKAHGAWVREETIAEVEHKHQQEAAENERKVLVKTFNTAVKETVQRHPDYSDVVTDSDVQLSGLMERRIYKSPVGPDMLYHFASNPEAAEEIMSMDADDQVAAMVQLETRIKREIKASAKEAQTEESEDATAVPPKKTVPPKKLASKAPLPPSRLKPNTPVPKTVQELASPVDRSGVDLDYNPEYERQRRAQRQP